MIIILDQDSDAPPCVPPIETMAQFYEFVVNDISRVQFYKATEAKYFEGRFYAELYCTQAGWLWNLAEIQEEAV